MLPKAWPSLVPLIVLATAATVIASQAVITGAFSLVRQAIQLGLLPRLEMRTSHLGTHAGQIYLPRVNALLLVGVMAAGAVSRRRIGLAVAYGIAVSATMVARRDPGLHRYLEVVELERCRGTRR
jgi:KUP system potassium uptake protein